jgi:hypothetical protein
MVPTYSLDCGTGASATVTVCTGIACIPPAAGPAGFFWQPVAASTRSTKQPIPEIRFNSFFLTLSFSRNQ